MRICLIFGTLLAIGCSGTTETGEMIPDSAWEALMGVETVTVRDVTLESDDVLHPVGSTERQAEIEFVATGAEAAHLRFTDVEELFPAQLLAIRYGDHFEFESELGRTVNVLGEGECGLTEESSRITFVEGSGNTDRFDVEVRIQRTVQLFAELSESTCATSPAGTFNRVVRFEINRVAETTEVQEHDDLTWNEVQEHGDRVWRGGPPE